jgi:RimJ/RimL family protein N-acetyltransferase
MTLGSQVVATTDGSVYARLEVTEIAAGDLQLRAWDDTHLAAVLAAAADPQIARWNAVRLPGLAPTATVTTPEQARQWIASRQVWDGRAAWAVCDATSGTALGYVSLHDLREHHLTGEVGYWVLPAARGRGGGRLAVAAAAGYGFGALALNRVELFHAVDNPASCGVATGAGFVLEGVARQAYRYGDGALHDDHMHARLASDSPPPDPPR